MVKNNKSIALLTVATFNSVINKLFATSEKIDIAVMFITQSGLQLIKDNLIKALENNTEIRILLGIDFHLTDTGVLQYLYKLMGKYYNLKIRVYSSIMNETFHPKFYVFTNQQTTNLILGSSNLSKGGIFNNVEANIISNDSLLVKEVKRFFERIFTTKEEKGNSIDLFPEFIERYKKEKKKFKPRDKKARVQRSTRTLLDYAEKSIEVKSRNSQRLLRDARKFIKSKKFPKVKKERAILIKEWRQSLDVPKFRNISKEAWYSLYKEGAIGGLNSVWRDRLWRRKKELLRNLMFLCNEQFPIEVRIDKILDGDFNLKGLNVGTITKILTIFDPNKYGVWNNRAAEFLKRYSAEITSGVTMGRKYRDWLLLLQKIRKCGYKNLAEVDYFVWDHSYD